MVKKSQGLSVNTLIIAVIVLLVLVVVVLIFTRYMGGWGSQVTTCASNGGDCVPKAECDTLSEGRPFGGEGKLGCDPAEICCAKGADYEIS